MKLKDEYNDRGALVDYMLDTHDGQRVLSKMPATVAEEIAKRADDVALGDEKGFELIVNGETYLPKDIFEFEDGELEKTAPKRTRRAARGTRPRKPAEAQEEREE
ncbi:hypothetical protein [Adlercreutzia sp. ZJ242]|uniref:hypothetical protein n=1 Tax=Adlercreutzia sp. ZJ242 TaxID=2709409 RepID=UPI0013ED30AA|nr:hypothetical protein [Adlercreutzia sp. ZJ242]